MARVPKTIPYFAKRDVSNSPLKIEPADPFVKDRQFIEPGTGRTSKKMDLDTHEVTSVVRTFDPYTRELLYTDYYVYTGRLAPDKYGVSRIKRVGNRQRHSKRVYNMLGGNDRLNNAFQSLMADLNNAGVSVEDIAILRNKWKKMSDVQKARAWNYYRKQKVVLQYGSSSSYTSSMELEDVSGYAFYDALETSMDAALRT